MTENSVNTICSLYCFRCYRKKNQGYAHILIMIHNVSSGYIQVTAQRGEIHIVCIGLRLRPSGK